ncbi:MAG: endolytic transglycosylase MltG [Deltaproteobacteria bacterium]|nr:endolytic transglycosylase MltG [Deltaproteobacteria bacterium]
MARKHQRVASVAVTATALGVLALLGYLAWDAWRYPDRPTDPAGGQAAVTIKRGMRFPEILAELASRRAVTRPTYFRLYANLTGRAHRIRAGQYALDRKMTPRQMLQRLVEGVKEEEVQVTIPEGKNMLEVVDLLAEAGVAPADDLLARVRDPGFPASLGLRGGSLEGYLFPDTYKFRPKTPAAKALGVLVKRHRQVFEDLRSRHPQGAEALKRKYKLNDRDAVTLASIVEKETGRADERPRVASVYLNRLAFPHFSPRKLQADPTIIYGCVVPVVKTKACQKFDGRIRRIQLNDTENPYNTYAREGLPPGPIGNPGRAALEAVFAPEQSTYLYFVSRNDGSHAFARTEPEHTANVRRFQLGPAPRPPAPAPAPP